MLTGLRVGLSTAINSNYLEGRSPLPKVAIGTGYRRNLKRRVTLFLNFTCIDLRVRTVANYFQNISPARCLGGHRFKSCRELRFFLCPTLVTCWLFRLHICPPSLKFTIFHSFTIPNLHVINSQPSALGIKTLKVLPRLNKRLKPAPKKSRNNDT